MKKSLPKRWMLVGILALIAVVVVALAVVVLNNQRWYTTYPGPTDVVEYDGKEYVTPLRTFFLLKNHLSAMDQDPMLANYSRAVGEKLETYIHLLTEFTIAKGASVDFISVMHAPFAPDMDLVEAVAASQIEAIEVLEREKFDVVGCEGSWSDPLIKETFYDEGVEGYRRENKRREIPDSFRSVTATDWSMRFTGIYKNEHPEAYLIGAEDKELFFLHQKVHVLIHTKHGSLVDKARYREYDKILVWLRTEIGLAKTLKVMREKGLKRGAFEMGQSHRYQFQVLARVLKLNSRIHQTVPKSHRDDEAG